MKSITATVVALILFLSLAITPALTRAQGTGGTDSYMNSGSTNGTNGSTGTNGTTGVTDNTGTTKDNGFNPMWLLPLLAIPVIYYLYKSSNDNSRDTGYDRGSIAGAKGGKSERRNDFENE
jgi:hypothetical protein